MAHAKATTFIVVLALAIELVGFPHVLDREFISEEGASHVVFWWRGICHTLVMVENPIVTRTKRIAGI
jgi:hypothetical protein